MPQVFSFKYINYKHHLPMDRNNHDNNYLSRKDYYIPDSENFLFTNNCQNSKNFVLH